MSAHDPVVITAAVRTPLGRFLGALSSLKAPELGAAVIRAALRQGAASPDDVSEVLMGCVLAAGLGQAPARQATLGAGLPTSVGATTVNKVCGSGMKAVMLAHDLIKAGSAQVVVAGGMESMSNAPYLLDKLRMGHRMGHAGLIDHMLFDGLEDPYDRQSMGVYGDLTAEHYGLTREAQDAFAMETLRRAQAALADGRLEAEIEPVDVQTRTGLVKVDHDELPGGLKAEKIPTLKAAFRSGGTVTAATSSANADGAAALVLTGARTAAERGMPVLARVVGHATHAHEPQWFTTAPIGAIKKLLKSTGWSVGDVDLWEINEAFAAVPMAAMHDLGLPHDRVNVNGGACAIGHPIGATGARILVTLVHAMRRRGAAKGVATLCIGGGEATAVAVELV